MLKACILKMFLNFLMVMPEPWKGSVSEVYQIQTTDGSDERKVFPIAHSLFSAALASPPHLTNHPYLTSLFIPQSPQQQEEQQEQPSVRPPARHTKL